MNNFEMPSFKKFSFSQFENISATADCTMDDLGIGTIDASDPNFFEE